MPFLDDLGLIDTPSLVDDYVAATAAEYYNDPLGFAAHMYPWGHEGTPLAGVFIRTWQAEILDEIGRAIRGGHTKIQIDIASGHGIGKSALIAMITQWCMTTRHTRGVITANTQNQLATKTMPEMLYWLNLFFGKSWIDGQATSLRRNLEKNADDWRIDAIPWSKENKDAFGGLHNAKGAVLVVFDEASGIHKVIWETVDGAMSDKHALIIWIRFGNPLRSVGAFADLFKKAPSPAVYTIRRNIDSRTVEGTDVEYINSKIAENGGEDSDYAKSRWRGVFPDQSDWQLISSKDVDAAMRREAPPTLMTLPVLMGIDFSRAGGDKTVVRMRRGFDGKSFRSYRWGASLAKDSMLLASMISTVINMEKPHHIFADNGGIGGPIIDRLRQLGHEVTPVDAGSSSDDLLQWGNRRAQMWCRMRDWLKAGGALDAEATLRSNLIQQEFQFRGDSQAILLITKEKMREDGLPSPDEAEALAQTFAFEVGPLHDPRDADGSNTSRISRAVTEYDPLDGM